jgi:hypothetical protein
VSALVHEAQRLADKQLRAEAVALAADSNDVAEARRVIEELSCGCAAREWR